MISISSGSPVRRVMAGLMLLSLVATGCSALLGASGQPSGPAESPLCRDPSASSAGSSPSASPDATEPASLSLTQPAATQPPPTQAALPTPTPAPTLPPDAPDLAEAGWFQVLDFDDGNRYELHVGRLDGRSFLALTTPDDIRGSGPVDGQVLAVWFDGADTVVDLVDTADGSRRELHRTTDRVFDASLAPDGEHWYWIPSADGRTDGLWRQPIAGGEPERVMDPWAGGGTWMTWATDGSRLVIFGDDDAGRRDYRVFQPDSGRVQEVLGTSHSDVVGFLGPEFLVYAHREGGKAYPLLGIDPVDGTSRTVIGEGLGIFAAVFPTDDGPRLVYERPDEDGRYRLLARGVDDGPATLVYTGEAPWFDVRAGMMGPARGAAIEVTGWLAVLPGTRAMLPQDRAHIYEGIPRLLIDVIDGTTIELPPLEESEVVE